MVCTQFEETSDPDGWGDNYLCAPQDYGFKWSMKGTIKGMQCLQVNEPSDQHTWHDNFLCWPPAGAARSNAVVSPPQNATDVINLVRARHNYQTYLELGQGTREDNFDAIGAKIKIGVDPDRKSTPPSRSPTMSSSRRTITPSTSSSSTVCTTPIRWRKPSPFPEVLNPGGSIVMQNLNPISPGNRRCRDRPTRRLEGRCVEGMGQAEGHAR